MHPPVRHYDFVGQHSLQNDKIILSLDAPITLRIPTSNLTYTLKLRRNKLLILDESILQLHDKLTGDVKKSSIVAHPYVGHVIDEFGFEVGWARIMFHSE
jgi:hypothetical protein